MYFYLRRSNLTQFPFSFSSSCKVSHLESRKTWKCREFSNRLCVNIFLPLQNHFSLLTAAFMDNHLANALSMMNVGGGGGGNGGATTNGLVAPAPPPPPPAAAPLATSANGESSSNSGTEN